MTNQLGNCGNEPDLNLRNKLRLIAATAIVEKLTLVSADAAFDHYGLTRLW